MTVRTLQESLATTVKDNKNKFKNIRCALVYDTYTSEMSRKHNNSNIIATDFRRVKKNAIATKPVSLFLTVEAAHCNSVRLNLKKWALLKMHTKHFSTVEL